MDHPCCVRCACVLCCCGDATAAFFEAGWLKGYQKCSGLANLIVVQKRMGVVPLLDACTKWLRIGRADTLLCSTCVTPPCGKRGLGGIAAMSLPAPASGHTHAMMEHIAQGCATAYLFAALRCPSQPLLTAQA